MTATFTPPLAPSLPRPTTLLAEVTHRCPLHCPYCSNPLELVRAASELRTDEWLRVITEARSLGVLQLGLSGGEPMLRHDLSALVSHARSLAMYATLVTSGLGFTAPRARELREAGLEHVQISVQDADMARAERIAGARSWEAKLAAARLVREHGFGFTVNVVLHRANIAYLEEIIALAASLGADRLELANTQYYGWATANRAALLPTREQLAAADAAVARATEQHRGRMRILYVLPDYFEQFPKPCMGGWGRTYLVVTPDGRVLPCHAASGIATLAFDSVRERSLDWIWRESKAFAEFRGEAWMPEPCRSCDRRHTDFGGCRCQAFALTGDARNTDPVCSLSAQRPLIDAAIATPATEDYRYRAPGTVSRRSRAPRTAVVP